MQCRAFVSWIRKCYWFRSGEFHDGDDGGIVEFPRPFAKKIIFPALENVAAIAVTTLKMVDILG